DEPPTVLYLRRLITVILLLLLIALFIILCIEVYNDIPSIKTTQKPNDRINTPTWCNNSITQLQNYTDYNLISFIPSRQASQINIRDYIRLTITFESGMTSLNSPINEPMQMFAFDPGKKNPRYDPIQNTYDLNQFPYNETFLQSINSISYFMSQNSYYAFIFSKKVRKLQNLYTFSQYIGLESTPYPIPYVEGTIQQVTYQNASANIPNFYAVISLKLQSTITEEETEQRNKTVITILGVIAGIYGGLFGLYTFLFGTDLIRPWGFVHYGCRGLRKKTAESLLPLVDNSLSNNKEPAQTRLESLGKLSIEQRVEILEKAILLFKDNIFDTKLLDSIVNKKDKHVDPKQ
ncbi:9091_t:CDS:2, partial [Dentiscutata erythropus]